MKPIKTSYPPHTLAGGKPYVPAAATDVRKTFDRIRQQQAQQREADPKHNARA